MVTAWQAPFIKYRDNAFLHTSKHISIYLFRRTPSPLGRNRECRSDVRLSALVWRVMPPLAAYDLLPLARRSPPARLTLGRPLGNLSPL